MFEVQASSSASSSICLIKYFLLLPKNLLEDKPNLLLSRLRFTENTRGVFPCFWDWMERCNIFLLRQTKTSLLFGEDRSMRCCLVCSTDTRVWRRRPVFFSSSSASPLVLLSFQTNNKKEEEWQTKLKNVSLSPSVWKKKRWRSSFDSCLIFFLFCSFFSSFESRLLTLEK